MTSKITAIVPARSGSKRLPDKNIRHLAGRPLLFYTLDAVVNQKLVTEVIFTSDSEEYIRLVEKEYNGSVRCVLRPNEYAQDKVKITSEIKRLIVEGIIQTDWFLLSLPTSPLFSHEHMDEFLVYWFERNSPLFTCNKYDFSPLFAFSIQENIWNPLIEESSPMVTGQTRSQDLKDYFRPNGAGYIVRCKEFLEEEILYAGAVPYIIPPELGTDIDNLRDFKFAEYLIGCDDD